MLVSAPGSSTNLGPGFDCLGLAVELPFLLSVGEPTPGRTMHEVEPTHPAAVAFRDAGGDAGVRLWWSSPIPPGRGLGFSGAARVAGAFAALRCAGADTATARSEAFVVAAGLEGHGDNAAASAHGGLTVAVDRTVVRLDPPTGVALLAWVAGAPDLDRPVALGASP